MRVDLDIDDLRPAIAAAVRDTLAQLADASELIPSVRLSYSEADAAAALGMSRQALGNARRRGDVRGALIGNKYFYSREELLAFLRRCETEPDS